MFCTICTASRDHVLYHLPRHIRVAEDGDKEVYTVQFKPSAEREFGKLAKQTQGRILAKLGALANDPRPPGVEKLKGDDDLYRVRVGDYRIVYEIHDDVLLVLVVGIGHRGEVYRRL